MSGAPSEVDQDTATNGTSSSVMMNLFQNLNDLGQRIKRVFINGKPIDDVIEDSFSAPVVPSDLLDQNNLLDGGIEDDFSPRFSYFVEKRYSGETLFIDRTEKVTLSAHLLGSCCISINDHPLDDQITGRGLAILQYLLFHHNQKQHREVLMSVFWPDAPPDSARNNLNVALHNLRQSFRSVTNLPVVEFHNEAYRFNPNLQIWLDVDEFEHHIQAGLKYKQSADIELAIKEYEIGIDQYQDDFLIDDPYEEWALAPRERLRIAYLNALGNLSQIYFSQEQYAACIALCQRILERDNCREDTHCLLMRCYSCLGQRSLALRQYQVCVDALRSELGVKPEIETEQLAGHIRSLGDI
jgi:DNA-binding SARP family transcriptional activator